MLDAMRHHVATARVAIHHLSHRIYDGHTLATVVPDMEKMIGNELSRILAAAGYNFSLLLRWLRQLLCLFAAFFLTFQSRPMPQQTA